jgi:hypothetical protein
MEIQIFFQPNCWALRRLIANALIEVLRQDKRNLSDDATVQAFFEKVVIFSAMARGFIAAVADSEGWDNFGQ